jgi:signal transduction histidine kinase
MNRMWVRLSVVYATIILIIVGVLILIVSQLLFEPDISNIASRLNLNEMDTSALEQLSSSGALQHIFIRVFISQLLGIFVLAISTGAVISIWLSWRITRPLTILDDAIRRVGSHEPVNQVQIRGSREVEGLAGSFNQMVAELESAEKRRQNLLADVSHELRTPLTILQGNLRGVLDDIYTLDKEQVAKLYNHTRQLNHLINDLHDLAQAEANQLKLNMMGIDLASLVQQAGQLFSPLAQDAGIEFVVQIDPRIPLIRGDRQRLMQVLQNLIANALHYAQSKICLTLTQDSWQVVLQIEDDGVGIDSSELPYIFDRFYRADSSRSRDTGGVGLGLAIAHSIVKAHNGAIAAQSIPSQGTTLIISLPFIPVISIPDQSFG